ncbi:hypothetical protein A3L04_05625 [Thermococcus chitonophagus]|uniref:ABC-2 type transport system permease protein n=1 Tax=Thermococcus chitonophagus TaxID=54262 RepID=A0A160VRE3_9EURY|nr:hypothetical protein [Thermococcus chitonophagus]ASJ16584.1 hypothetical protein A3L04_05625 [Thermococcus chitonophagus]CUX77497.1 hypothetical protein CHITON_0718 [Thermococcus chitonophagus]
MLWKIIKILYREVHYQMLKENVTISSNKKKFEDSLKWQANIKLGLGLQVFWMLVMGVLFGVSVALAPKDVKGIAFASLLPVPLIYAIYSTGLTASYLQSGRVFEPLKPLPIRNLNLLVSLSIFLEVLPALFLMLPSALFLGDAIATAMGIAWVLVTLIMGHAIGLFIQVKFGGVHVGKGSVIRNLAKVFGLLFMVGIYLIIQLLAQFIEENIEVIAPLFKKYYIAFPMAASTVYDPPRSILILLLYGIPFGLLYIYSMRRLWESIEGIKVYGKAKLEYKLPTKMPPLALFEKDYKIIFRKTQLLGSFLAPATMTLWFIYMVFKSGFPMLQGALLMISIGMLSMVSLDASFKVDMEAFEVLRSLPLTRTRYLRAKALTMAFIPSIIEAVILTIAIFIKGAEVIYLAPYALSPLLGAAIGIGYTSMKIRDVEMPNFGIMDGILLLLLMIMPIVIAGLILFFMGSPYVYLGLGVAYVAISLIVLWRV